MKTEEQKHGLVKRFRLPTPAFFKKIIVFGTILGIICGGILSSPLFGDLTLPDVVNTVLWIGVAFGGACAMIAKFTIKDDMLHQHGIDLDEFNETLSELKKKKEVE